MTGEMILILVARWLHILSACLALGIPIFVHLCVLPAIEPLADAERIRETIAARWRRLVYISIVIFLATGLSNFLRPGATWRTSFAAGDPLRMQYHIVFGIKFILAFVLFFLLSALAGRSAALATFRTNARMWLGVSILIGLAILALSAWLRF